MMQMREQLAGMGTVIEERDFYAILLGSLLESYCPLLSSINATACIAKTPLSPYKLANIVSEEYEHWQLLYQATGLLRRAVTPHYQPRWVQRLTAQEIGQMSL